MAFSLIPFFSNYLAKNSRGKNVGEDNGSSTEQGIANLPSQLQNNLIDPYQIDARNSFQAFYSSYQASSIAFQPAINNPAEGATTPIITNTNVLSVSAPTDLALDAQMMILGMPDDGSAPIPERQSTKLPTEYLVQFNQGVSLSDRNTVLSRLNASTLEVVHAADSNSGDLVLVRVPPDTSSDVLSVLGNAPGVKFAEPNWSIGVQAFSNDTYYSNGSLWGMYGDTTSPRNIYGSQAGEAWASGFTGQSKTVIGIIDTGIDYTHPDLYLNIWLNQGELPTGMALRDIDLDGLITFRDLNNSINSSFVSDLNNNGRIDAGDILNDARWENGSDQDNNGFIDDLVGWDFVNRDNDPYDDQAHGTHVAGTIGATGGNGIGVAGVNWNVQMMGLKFLSATGSGSTAGAIQAIDYYTTASAIDQSRGWSSEFIGTNNSWGGGGFSQSLLDSIIRSAYQDALFIAAAGNGGADGVGDNNDAIANYPSNYSTLAAVGFESVIAVAATTSSGGLASYSNFGTSTVDLGAPGSSIWSTVPGGGYASYSGTSMATPHVTGALALYASQNPTANSAQLRSQLLSNTTALAALAGKTVTGGTLDIGKMISGGTPPDDITAPLLSSATPADNSTNVAVGANLVMSFNENVLAGSGNIQIYNSNGTIARTIAVTDTSQVTFSGNTVTINPTADLTGGAGYYVNMASGVIRDTAGNNFAGINNATAWNFTTIPVDTSAPLLSSATPADNSTNVAVGANLVMSFNENVLAGSGNIQIYNSNGTIARTIAVTDTSQVTFSGNTVTINPTADLTGGAGYYVNMASGVIRDTAGNNFAGINNATAWNFTTIPVDTSAPLLSSATPTDNSTNVAVGANLVMTFNETVRAGSGNIQIYNSNGTIARTIAVTDTSQVTFSGNTVTINPTADLAGSAGYYVNMASGVIRDTAGNNFAGISNATAWNFTTIPVDTSAPLLSSATPTDNSTNVAVGANLVMTFNETVRAGSGNIQIYNSNGTIARTIAVTDTSQVTFSGNTVTINPTADLTGGAGYYVNMASGVIRDTAGNNFAGINNATAWNFTTLAPQDYAGNTLSTAWNIGVLTGSRTFADFVGSIDTNDYYRFTLNSRSNFGLTLTGMSADADVHILSASGSVIASSTAGGANNESISQTLDAGNYYVRVYQYSGDTQYTLSLNQQNVTAPASGVARYGTDSNDVVTGTSFADLLSGVPITGALIGRGSIDRLTGGLGNDLFIFGDARGRFYDDQILGNSGTQDYGLISDFQVSGDRVQLSSGYYFLATTTLNGATGTGIYHDSDSNRSFGANDELVGILQGVSAPSLSNGNFTWI